MFNGKTKAITFSYDDGVTQDIRLIELFDKYGVKGTFNINSELLGQNRMIGRDGEQATHNKVLPSEVNKIYKNHEIAVHTLTHPNLTTLPEDEIIRQVEEDRLKLSDLAGYEVVGMAYPCGGVNNDDRVAEIIKNHTGVKFSRTITSSFSFDKQSNLFRFNPTVYHNGDGFEKMKELADKFFSIESDEPQIFYIWGHSYEFDMKNNWDDMEDFLKYISFRDDVFYGTNSEVLLEG